MSTQTQWSALETNGFVVARSFFSEAEVSTLREDFAKGAPPSSYPHGFKLMSRRALDCVSPRVLQAAEEIQDQMALRVDIMPFLTFSHYIMTERTERTSYWHQDFDFDYKLTRDHINYLNFYVPIVKPTIEKSNVCVIPYEALRARAPEGFSKLQGSGGHRLVPTDGKTFVYGNYGAVLEKDEVAKSLFQIDCDIEGLALTPYLAAGDLLVMRGDIVHRTQDASTQRTAASIRITYSKKIIRRERVSLERTGDPASQLEGLVLRCLDKAGKDAVTIEEFMSFLNGARSDDVALT